MRISFSFISSAWLSLSTFSIRVKSCQLSPVPLNAPWKQANLSMFWSTILKGALIMETFSFIILKVILKVSLIVEQNLPDCKCWQLRRTSSVDYDKLITWRKKKFNVCIYFIAQLIYAWLPVFCFSFVSRVFSARKFHLIMFLTPTFDAHHGTHSWTSSWQISPPKKKFHFLHNADHLCTRSRFSFQG